MAEILTVAARHAGQPIERVFHAGQEADFVFGRGTTMFAKLPAEIYGRCETRVVLDADERWFEFGFRMDHALTGNAASGWLDAGNYFRLEPQWSLDLVAWSMGKFIPAPVPVVDLGDGSFEYWSRALHPVDSAVKSAQISVKSGEYTGAAWEFGGDSRNNPFTSLTIEGVALALGGWPYTMPADAARMTTDLQPFYPGSTVTATTDTAWQIIIPAVNMTSFLQTNSVNWPMYLVADMFGEVNTPYDGVSLSGNFVNAAGVAVHPSAFARLKITAGSRYDPYR